MEKRLIFNFDGGPTETDAIRTKGDLTDNILTKLDFSEVRYNNLLIKYNSDINVLAKARISIDSQKIYLKCLY